MLHADKTPFHGISSATFEQLFPFFFIVNHHFEVESLGSSLASLLRDYTSTGDLPIPFTALFASTAIRDLDSIDTLITLADQLIELTLTPLNLSFKGQIIVSTSPNTHPSRQETSLPSQQPLPELKIIFCGSPSIKDFSHFQTFGLSTSQFALHDMTISHAVLFEMYQTQMNELHSLNARLKQSAKEKKRLLTEATFQANYDSLTGLTNRRHFCALLKQKIESLQQDQLVGMCILGLDEFKSINDFLGYQAGDAYLIEITHRLKQCCQQHDIVARMGGDEFALLLIGRSNADTVYTDMSCLLEKIQQPLKIGRETWASSASIGVDFLQPNLSVTQLLRRCDDAMHEAKSKRKGGIVVYNHKMGERQRQRNFVHTHLEHAIQAGALQAFFQPIIHTNTGLAYSMEALARWKKPDGGWISPVEFIPHIEGSDLSSTLGEAIIDYSLSALAEIYRKLGNRTLYISINVSARQLYGNNLIHTLKQYCEKYDIAPHNIILEITETSLLMDEIHIQSILTQLKNMNIKIALDDFGTGFSSLSYLSRFPFDILKVDRAFIHNIHKNDVNKKLVAAIVNMANALDLRVVAEGIEKKEELAVLNDLDVAFIQGYYYSKPLPLADTLAFLQR